MSKVCGSACAGATAPQMGPGWAPEMRKARRANPKGTGKAAREVGGTSLLSANNGKCWTLQNRVSGKGEVDEKARPIRASLRDKTSMPRSGVWRDSSMMSVSCQRGEMETLEECPGRVVSADRTPAANHARQPASLGCRAFRLHPDVRPWSPDPGCRHQELEECDLRHDPSGPVEDRRAVTSASGAASSWASLGLSGDSEVFTLAQRTTMRLMPGPEPESQSHRIIDEACPKLHNRAGAVGMGSCPLKSPP